MEIKDQGPSPLREAATFPPQADHFLVDLFFICGGPGGFVKAPRHGIKTESLQENSHICISFTNVCVYRLC